jgi:REP element-mobilizing transposase RayT
MARKLRLEFPGACYHVINRGNYRTDVFRDDRTKAAFEACLFEACEKSQWLLHAFVVMRNHYHLAIETPHGNLVAGMHWLQAAFATRFNRLRSQRGHLFQGRYKALLVEDGDPLAMVCHYIHLNPARARAIPMAQLPTYRYSSYWYLRRSRIRPNFLRFETALRGAGNLTDSSAGWKQYHDYLGWQMDEGPAGGSQAYVSLSRGWALGGTEFKAALIEDHALVARTRAWESIGANEIREHAWGAALERVIQLARLTKAELTRLPKSDRSKIAVGAWMKSHTQASNRWLCTNLHLGTPDAFSHNLTLYRRSFQPADKLWKLLNSSSVT